MIRMPDVFFRRGYQAADLKFRDGSTDGLREIAILEQSVCHKSRWASAEAVQLGRMDSAAELVDDPENQTDEHADDQARDEREIESAVLAAMDDVARQATEAEGKFAAEVEKHTDDDKNGAQNEQRAAELLERFHLGDCSLRRAKETGKNGTK